MATIDLFRIVVGTAVLVAVPTVCIWHIWDALQNSVVRLQFGSFSRARDPIWYWASVMNYVGLLAWCAFLPVRLALLT